MIQLLIHLGVATRSVVVVVVVVVWQDWMNLKSVWTDGFLMMMLLKFDVMEIMWNQCLHVNVEGCDHDVVVGWLMWHVVELWRDLNESDIWI